MSRLTLYHRGHRGHQGHTNHRVPRRRWPYAVGGVVLIVLAVAGWLTVRGLKARHELTAARTGVTQLRADLLAGRTTLARRHLTTVTTHATRAHALTHDVVWRAVGALPWLGAPVASITGTANAVDQLARGVLPELVRTGTALSPATLRHGGDTIDLAPLRAAQAPLAQAEKALAAVAAALHDVASHTLLSPADSAHALLAAQVADLRATVHDGSLAAQLLPPMLGGAGTRRYFIAFQTNAEARGTGGLVGAYGIIEATDGRVHFAHLGADTELRNAAKPVVDFGPDYAQRYDAFGSRRIWVNANISPHFPYAARTWAALWQRQSGQHLDGVLATDPVVLSYLLRGLGPVTLSNGQQVTAGNAVRYVEAGVYAQFTDVASRKTYLQDIAKTIADKLLGPQHGSAAELLSALRQGAGEHRLLVWSAHPEEESVLAPTVLGGVLPAGPAPMAGLIVNNAAGSKLDYYLDRTLRYVAGPCQGGTRNTTATITLTNNAPKTGLPDYVVIRADQPKGSTVRGSESLLVSYYATAGANVTAASLDGTPTGVANETERGHPVFTATVVLLPGQTRTLVLHLREPAVPGTPVVLRQPLVRPFVASVVAPICTPASSKG